MTFIVSCVLSLKAIIFHAFFSHLIGCLQIITSPVNTLLVLNMNTSSLVEKSNYYWQWLAGRQTSISANLLQLKKKNRKEINCNSKITIFCLILSRKSLLYITKMHYCFFFRGYQSSKFQFDAEAVDKQTLCGVATENYISKSPT